MLGFLCIIPTINVSPAQEPYVGPEEGDDYLYKFGLYKTNWGSFFTDNLEGILNNLWPLGSSSLLNVFQEWQIWQHDPPQSHWPFEITAIGSELTSSILFPFDNMSITSTPVNATTGWFLPHQPDLNSYYNSTWYIVNDTSSFLRQTFNLSLAFSPYGIMSVPIAPKNVNWTFFISKFLAEMNLRGGFYNNTSAIAKSNGYSLNIPAWGYENNSVAIDIRVSYNSNGILTNYEFLYDGKLLVRYWIGSADLIPLGDMLTIIWGVAITTGIIIIIVVMRWVIRHNN